MKGLMGLPTMGLLKLTNQLGTKGVRRRKKLKSSQCSFSSSAFCATLASFCGKSRSSTGCMIERDIR